MSTSSESDILVNVVERLRDLVANEEIGYADELIYEYRAGYEILTVKRDGGGGSEYRGVFHPNVVCEGNGICKWCGTVW